MDFWDLTRLLGRRWYVCVPLLLISAAGAFGVTFIVKPDFSATSHVQLLPAVVSADTPNSTGPRNPWSDLGVDALGQAAMTAVLDQDVLQGLVDKGYTDNVTIGMDGPSPIITVTAVARTAQLASSTDTEVARLLDQHVAALQAPYGVANGQYITTRVLDSSPNTKKVNSKVTRALLVVAGVGVLLTVALTVLADVLIRRSSRRAKASPISANVGEAFVDPALTQPLALPRRQWTLKLNGLDHTRSETGPGASVDDVPGAGGGGVYGGLRLGKAWAERRDFVAELALGGKNDHDDSLRADQVGDATVNAEPTIVLPSTSVRPPEGDKKSSPR